MNSIFMLSQEEQKALNIFYSELDTTYIYDEHNSIPTSVLKDRLSEELRNIVFLEYNALTGSGERFSALYSNRRELVKEYLDNRILKTRSNIIKAKYFYSLFYLTKNNKYCQSSIELFIEHINNINIGESYFIDLLNLIVELSLKIKYYTEEVKYLINDYLYNKDILPSLKIFILRIVKKHNLFTVKESAKTPLLCIKLAELENNHNLCENVLLIGLFFAKKIQDAELIKRINEYLGDNEYKNVIAFEKGKSNDFSMIPFQNISSLKKIIQYYKDAQNDIKWKNAAKDLEKNKRLKIIPKISVKIPKKNAVEEIQLLDMIFKNIVDSSSIIITSKLCHGGINLLFLPLEKAKQIAQESIDKYSWFNYFESVQVDINNNEFKVDNFEYGISQAYGISLNRTIAFTRDVICTSFVNKKLNYVKLSAILSKYSCFGIPWEKNRSNETEIEYTWLSIIDIGLKEFFVQIKRFIEGKECDWRFTIDFLTPKFESILRDIIGLNGGNITKVVNGNTREYLLDDLLNEDTAFMKTFNEDDKYFFEYVFTNIGYNIRNNVAHGFFYFQDYTISKAILVLLCILRLAKYSPNIEK